MDIRRLKSLSLGSLGMTTLDGLTPVTSHREVSAFADLGHRKFDQTGGL